MSYLASGKQANNQISSFRSCYGIMALSGREPTTEEMESSCFIVFRIPETFRREDLASSLLRNATVDLADMTYLFSNLMGLSRVVFCGGFFGPEIVRSVMTSSMVNRNIWGFMMAQVSFTAYMCM